ncbi:MAG: hypothetical protein IJ694_04905 [Acidaminococcaceae bacterium]|nr:hypothetical protein [Acidaminococcaceae bacterium]
MILMTGRPRKDIDREQFEKLCMIQCTLEEIAGWFHCSQQTIRNWAKETYKDENGKPMNFLRVYKKYSSPGKISLRRIQFRLAEKSATMAIFLGKQYLGQTDWPPDIEMTKLRKEKLRADIESAKQRYGTDDQEETIQLTVLKAGDKND